MVANQTPQEPLKRVPIKLTRPDTEPSQHPTKPLQPGALNPGNVIDATILAKAQLDKDKDKDKDKDTLNSAPRKYISPLNLRAAANDPEYQGKVVDSLLEQGFVPETIQYAVDYSWWTRWRAWTRTSRLRNDEGSAPGPVTNERLLNPNICGSDDGGQGEMVGQGKTVYGVEDMDERFEENKDYLFVPAEVWEALHCMNGGGGVAIVKEVDVPVDPNTLFPQYKLPEDPATWQTKWDQKYGIPSRPHPKYEPKEAEDEDEEENAMEMDSEDVLEEFRSGRRQVKVCIACLSNGARLTCRTCQIARYCSAACQESHWSFHRRECRKKVCHSLHSYFGRRGKVGLSNLGNTCFLNSTIQCLSHTWPLTRYFLNNSYSQEVNKNSKLGTGGDLVNVYNSVIKELWFGSASSHSPSKLKEAVGKLPGSGRQFSGYMQQDAQELLVFLLDTLHEDLNLVQEKAIIPQSDENEVDKRSTKEQAAESLFNNSRRDHSIITRIFQGQTQSTLTCPQCNHQSVTFSPFMFLPLAIPTKADRTILVTLVSQKAERTQYAVTLPKTATFKMMLSSLRELSGIAEDHIWLVDLFKNGIWETHLESFYIKRVKQKDIVYAFELDPAPETFTVALFQSGGGTTLIGTPICFTSDNKTTFSQLRRDILKAIGPVINKGAKDAMELDEEEVAAKLPVFLCDKSGTRHSFVDWESKDEDGMESDEAIIPNTEEVVVEVFPKRKVMFFAIDWAAMESQFGWSYDSVEVVNHESAKLELATKRTRPASEFSLQDCLRHFLRAEQLDHGNTWSCPKCKKNQRAYKSGAIRRLPEVLILFLKRFEHSSASRNKLATQVDFPLSSLDMREHLADDVQTTTQETVYDLYAVTNHYGSMGFGHYTAFIAGETNCKSEASNWYEVDDCRITPENAQKICSPAAYVLYYRKRQICSKGRGEGSSKKP